MKKFTGLFITIFFAFTIGLGGVSDAEAKRFGGARSFGGKSGFSSPYRRSVSPSRSASQKQAYQKNQAARQAMGRRGGLMGMLGGLALGGLLGAMFFGGAFEGLNFMDILIFGGLAYLLYRLFAAKASKRQPAYQYQQDDESNYSQYRTSDNQTQSGFDTDVLFNKNKASSFSEQDNYQDDADFNELALPKGFDQVEFLNGAKQAFYLLQKAWDSNDLAEIRGLTTDKVFAEIQQQLKESEGPNKTEVLKLDAELLDVRELETEMEAVVLFNAIIREDDDSQAHQVQEVWHFVKPKNSIQPTWYLDGIQQLAD